MKKYSTPSDPRSEKDHSTPSEGTDKITRYQTGPSPMLVFIKSKDIQQAFAYAYLLKASYQGSDGIDVISLDYGFCTVTLTGIKLGKIYGFICAHDMILIPELENAELERSAEGVSKIEILDKPNDNN